MYLVTPFWVSKYIKQSCLNKLTGASSIKFNTFKVIYKDKRTMTYNNTKDFNQTFGWKVFYSH